MKTSPKLETVEVVDNGGDLVPYSKPSAARPGKRHSYPETKTNKHEENPSLIFEKSRCRGSVTDLVTTYSGSATLTIFSTSKDQSESGNEIKGHCFRKIFLTDENESLKPDAAYERRRCVKLVILISHTDEIFENPTVFVEQRVYKNGQGQTVIHELIFGTVVRLGLEYVFAGCGDEDQALGKRDLFIRFQSVDETLFSEHLNRARYYGYDRHETVLVDLLNLIHGSGVEYNVTPCEGVPGLAPFSGFIGSSELRRLRLWEKSATSRSTNEVELMRLTFRRFGKWTEDRRYGGDLILHSVYKS